MILTTQQVQRIFELVKLHIPYYDLQVEMVDHLASSIEEQIEQDKGLSFEQALQIAYAAFGSSGFKLLIRKRRKSLVKQKWNMWFQSLVKQVTTSQLILTIVIFVIAAFSATFWEKEINEVMMLLVLMSYFIISLSAEYIIGKKTKHKLLLTETFRASIFGFIFPQMFLWIIVQPQIHNAFGFATAVTGFVLMLKATLAVNKNSLNTAQQLYPEAFVNAN